MQILDDLPRDNIPTNQVIALLQGTNAVEVTTGIQIYMATKTVSPFDDLAIIDDWSDIMLPAGSSISYDNTAKISNTAALVLDPAVWELLGNASLLPSYQPPGSVDGTVRRIYWGNPRTRIRVYMDLASPGLPTARFYLGVYVLATPSAAIDSPQALYTVTCYDQICMFDVPIVDSITYPVGTVPFDAVQTLINEFNILNGHQWWIAPGAGNQDATLLTSMSWTVDSGATYLDVINELLGAIGYDNLWSDWMGVVCLTPFNDPRTRIPDWILDTTDPETSIVDPESTWQPDTYQVPNTWRFIQNGLPFAPVEGAGQYTVVNQSNGPTSIDSQQGRVLLSYHTLDAASQTDLMTQGDQIVVNESLPAEVFNIQTTPFPIAWHKDVVKFITDNAEPNMFAADNTELNARQCYVASWSLPLDGSPMSWTIGTVG